MSYQRGQYNFDESTGPSNFAEQLGLTNLGLTIFPLVKGEGFDFFHSHREQEEVYLCLEGSAVLLIKADDGEVTELQFGRGEIVRVEPHTLRAVGNLYSDRAQVLVAGACPHTYPAGFGHHDVIADVRAIVGRGDTGFKMPGGMEHSSSSEGDISEDDC